MVTSSDVSIFWPCEPFGVVCFLGPSVNDAAKENQDDLNIRARWRNAVNRHRPTVTVPSCMYGLHNATPSPSDPRPPLTRFPSLSSLPHRLHLHLSHICTLRHRSRLSRLRSQPFISFDHDQGAHAITAESPKWSVLTLSCFMWPNTQLDMEYEKERRRSGEEEA